MLRSLRLRSFPCVPLAFREETCSAWALCRQAAELSEEDEEEDVSLSSSLEELSAFDSSAGKAEWAWFASHTGSGPRRPLRPSSLPLRSPGPGNKKPYNLRSYVFRSCRGAGASSSACSASRTLLRPVQCRAVAGMGSPARLLSLGLRLLQQSNKLGFEKLQESIASRIRGGGCSCSGTESASCAELRGKAADGRLHLRCFRASAFCRFEAASAIVPRQPRHWRKARKRAETAL